MRHFGLVSLFIFVIGLFPGLGAAAGPQETPQMFPSLNVMLQWDDQGYAYDPPVHVASLLEWERSDIQDEQNTHRIRLEADIPSGTAPHPDTVQDGTTHLVVLFLCSGDSGDRCPEGLPDGMEIHKDAGTSKSRRPHYRDRARLPSRLVQVDLAGSVPASALGGSRSVRGVEGAREVLSRAPLR